MEFRRVLFRSWKTQVVEDDLVLLFGKMVIQSVLENFEERVLSTAVSRRVQEFSLQVFVDDGKRNMFHGAAFVGLGVGGKNNE